MGRAAATTAVVLACVVPAACGGDDEESERGRLIEALDEARKATVQARVVIRADSEKDGRMSMRGSVVSNGTGTRGRLRVIFSQYGEVFPMEMILHEKEAWYRSPALRGLLPPGKRWLWTTDPEVVNTPSLSPDAFAEMLDAAGDVREVGRERVRGVPATRLRATVDLDELAEQAEGEPGAERFVRLMGQSDDAELTTDIWVGKGKRPLRFRASARMPRPGGGRPQWATCDIVVEKYDVPVDAAKPPLPQIVPESVLD